MVKNTIQGINGLRAISIVTVILYHLSNIGYFKWIITHPWTNATLGLFLDGPLGVNLFFVISGFLVSLLLIEEKNKTGRIQFKGFYLKRGLRIFPAYYTLLLVYSILSILGIINFTPLSWLTSFTFTKVFCATEALGFDIYSWHFWSLSIEVFFYAIAPFVFSRSARLRNIILWMVIFTAILMRIFIAYKLVPFGPNFYILTRIDALIIGSFIAINNQFLWNRLQKLSHLALLLPLIGLCAIRLIQPWSVQNHSVIRLIFIPLGNTTGIMADFFLGLILLYTIKSPKSLGWVKLLDSKLLAWLGLISYSLYLWQQIFIFGLNYTLLPRYSIGLALLALICIASASYHFIEKPILKWGRQKLNLFST